jgi:RHS repeat-associated protein
VGNVTALTYPSGRQIEFERDALGRTTAVRQLARGNAYPGDMNLADIRLIARVGYEGLRRKKITYDNGTSTEYGHDAGGRTVEIHHRHNQQTILNLQLLPDAVNNLRQQIEAAGAVQRKLLFRYDTLYRVVETREQALGLAPDLSTIGPAVAPVPDPIPNRQSAIDAFIEDSDNSAQRRYDYDAQGNRLSSLSGAVSMPYQPNALDQYDTAGAESYRYDKNGNRIEDDYHQYVYDHRNQLSKIVTKNSPITLDLFYDGLGRNVLASQEGVTVCRAFDGFNRLEEYEDGDLRSSTIYDDGSDNMLTSARENGESYFYRDLTGSVRHVYRSEQSAQSYRYDEFGNVLNGTDPADGNPFRFQGKSWISLIGKYDFNYRTYDPVIGRFWQRDPLGLADGSNRYAFSGNNPLTFVDPLGAERAEKDNSFDMHDAPHIYGGEFAQLETLLEKGHKTLEAYVALAHKQLTDLIVSRKEFETSFSAWIRKGAFEAGEERLKQYIRWTESWSKRLGSAVRVLKVFGPALDALGFGLEFYEKFWGGESPAQTRLGKFVDAGGTASINTAFGVAYPFISAIDHLGGWAQKAFFGKNYLSINKTMKGAVSTISTVAEGIWTGDITGMEALTKKAESGELSGAFEFYIFVGEYHAKDPNVAYRVETTGNFYGDNVAGRAAAFGAALPGIGWAGEKLGHGAGWTVVKAVDGAKFVAHNAESLYDSVTDFFGYEIDW